MTGFTNNYHLKKPLFRITSYNVCYTKLLREEGENKGKWELEIISREMPDMAKLTASFAVLSQAMGAEEPKPELVITSYSIHYTKLYENYSNTKLTISCQFHNFVPVYSILIIINF